MKTPLPSSITTVTAAKHFLKALIDNRESFNPDDNVHTLNVELFTKKEGDIVNRLISQIHQIKNFDAHRYILSLDDAVVVTDTYVIKRVDQANIKDRVEPYGADWEDDCILHGQQPFIMWEYIGDIEINTGFILEYKEGAQFLAVIGQWAHLGTKEECHDFIIHHFNN